MKHKHDTETRDLFATDYEGWQGALAGMQTAEDHAEDEAPGWGDRALALVALFVAEHPGETFVTPQVRAFAEARGLDAPASVYAWGSVLRRARSQGLVSPVGYTQHGDLTTNTQPVRLWRARGRGGELSLADQVRLGLLGIESALEQARREGYRAGKAKRLQEAD